jgi:aspartate racemase
MDELLKSIIREDSKARFMGIIGKLKSAGAEAIVLGCTEIPMIVKPEDTQMKLYNTLDIHCRAIVDFALGD